ncbi:MAG TPA: hypothetical protein H9833_04540 [Candidatus Evtepia faecavium]|nr:hypothetical protein [Candidatus Evtepia faecavium]
MSHSLTRPEVLTLIGPGGETYRGGDQEWYPDLWQRRAGCGPTTAAALLAYLSQTRPALAPLRPLAGGTRTGFAQYMQALWPYVIPGSRGLDKPESLVLGCRSFALSRGCVLQGEVLKIPRRRENRPTPAACRDFLLRALDNDCPVAFLNYSNGSLPNLDSWHWVPLIALTEGEEVLLCTVLDEGEEKVIDLALWLETTLLGGALAAVFP